MKALIIPFAAFALASCGDNTEQYAAELAEENRRLMDEVAELENQRDASESELEEAQDELQTVTTNRDEYQEALQSANEGIEEAKLHTGEAYDVMNNALETLETKEEPW